MEFKKTNRIVKINGHDVEVTLTVRVEEDFYRPEGDFDFGNAKANEEYLERFKRGELFMAFISVTATALGETGHDGLGACHIHSNNFFDSTKFNDDIEQVLKDYALESNAIKELINNIKSKAGILKKFA